ncbi:Vacuolar protein sorting-associated protein 37A [Phlyctochytrium planicorne]|nr:Vacuolar protein sorting-associated protein 37A [Phlyctochytrium planicorne]
MNGTSLNARELKRDILYEVSVHLPTQPIFLQINLPPNFPDGAPTIVVKPPLVHPWIGANSIVTGHEKLRSWNQHMSLGKIVQEVVQEFVARNPAKANPLVGSGGGSQGGFVGAAGSMGGGVGLDGPSGQAGPAYSANPLVRQQQQQQQSPHQTPSMPQVDFMGLEKKRCSYINSFDHADCGLSYSVEELEELMNDEAAFEDFFQSLPQVKEQQKVKSDYVLANESLANQNLALEGQLAQLRSELEEEYRIFRTQREQFDLNYKSFQNLSMRYAPDYIMSRLRTAVTESEELSESISQSFLGGKSQVEDFVRNYRETRKVYHHRSARLERVLRDPKLLTPS